MLFEGGGGKEGRGGEREREREGEREGGKEEEKKEEVVVKEIVVFFTVKVDNSELFLNKLLLFS